jgi:branched-chain amino acid transport system ATP-binding protein
LASPLLEAKGLSAGYGAVQVLFDVSLSLAPGDLMLLAGPNGAGKSTLMRTLIGLHAPSAGSLEFEGTNLLRMRPHDRARAGIAWIPEGRGVIGELSVEDNLDTARFSDRWRPANRDLSFDRFPVLATCLPRPASTLSGGEQQMLALARALETLPSLLLVDEPSLGLAPKIVNRVMDSLMDLQAEGQTILLVEQRAAQVQHVATRIELMNRGRMTPSHGGGIEFTEMDFSEFTSGDLQDGEAQP